ncbi:MAG: zf-HC2 domain-containing protein [Treponema sp.]|nr:zf-HC2 domain-containing protein [Treponema sp.]
MSFCPTKDIHSIYLDNEMPEIYRAEYESHLKECPKCQKELEKLRVMHELFADDSKLITPADDFLDKSFEKLQIKMKYAKNVNSVEETSAKKFKYFIPSVAAAAVVALAVALPLRTTTAKVASDEAVPAIASIATPSMAPVNNVSFGGGNSVVLSGNIHESVMSPARNSGNGSRRSSRKAASRESDMITNYDVFRPAFTNEDTISIRITVPGADTEKPVSTEIELPLTVIMGQQ